MIKGRRLAVEEGVPVIGLIGVMILAVGLTFNSSSAPITPDINAQNSNSLYQREVVLSRRHSTDNFLKATLVSIAKHGATTIKVTSTGEKLQAVPGHFFSSTYYGAEGLQLISASSEKHEARFLKTWCVSK
jgi:hypothetical protein